MQSSPDIVIIGSGMGGASLAAGLAPTGAPIVILERGVQIADDAPARDPNRIFRNSAFLSDETWLDENGRRFAPGNYYQVGGNTKLYGAVLIRYRAEDFAEMQHAEGVSPAWPFPYETLAPWYEAAERLYRVRGDVASDPTEPAHDGQYPFPPVPDEPAIAAVRARVQQTGIQPFDLPLGVDIERWLQGGKTGWDGYPDTRSGKMDAETCGLAAALAHENVELVTGARVIGLKTGPDGKRITEVIYQKDGETHRLTPGIVALCAGAVKSAALLLTSGLPNSSDQVGRCFMNHNASALIAFDPRFHNDSVYQKTFGINDWYLSDGEGGPPLGNIQLLGRVVPDILQANVRFLPKPIAAYVSGHAIDLYAMSEDLPDPDSRIVLNGTDIQLIWRRSNMVAQNRLVGKIRATMRAAGFPIVLSRLFDGRVPSHQCGTVRIGSDPALSALDPECRSWDHPNLFVTDAACLPTSAAVNPALTVAAMALRAADTIRKDLAA